MTETILKTKDYKTFQAGFTVIEGAARVRPALPGDTVLTEFLSTTIVVTRAAHKNLVGVLELASPIRYGFTSRGAPIYLFTPWNTSYPPFYVGSTYQDITKNVIAIVDFDSWSPTANCPKGVCRRILGPCGNIESEELGLLLNASPKTWPARTPALLPPVATPLNEINPGTFHIDPPGCRDIDDAITMIHTLGGLEVRIHIADVASWLLTNEWLWDAEQYGQTLYNDGAVIAGMFPRTFEETISLLPNTQRKTLTLAFTWTAAEGVKGLTWSQEEIVVVESYTYESILESDKCEMLEAVTSSLKGQPVTDPHDWVAELMLFYNKEAAKILRANGRGILRRHNAPDLETLETLKGVGGVPEHLAYKAGEYCNANDADVRHWGLGEDVYCHASSPIRRWADCMNQVQLLGILFGVGKQTNQWNQTLPDTLNMIAKRSKAYERDVFFVRILLNERLGAVDGVIAGISEGKIRVWIEAWKRLVTVYMPVDGWGFEPSLGLAVQGSIYYNSNQRNWKQRLVLRVVAKN